MYPRTALGCALSLLFLFSSPEISGITFADLTSQSISCLDASCNTTSFTFINDSDTQGGSLPSLLIRDYPVSTFPLFTYSEEPTVVWQACTNADCSTRSTTRWESVSGSDALGPALTAAAGQNPILFAVLDTSPSSLLFAQQCLNATCADLPVPAEAWEFPSFDFPDPPQIAVTVGADNLPFVALIHGSILFTVKCGTNDCADSGTK